MTTNMYKLQLRKEREKNNYTQEDLAKIINTSRSTYATYETEFLVMPIKHLTTLSDYLNVSLDYLFGFTKTKRYNNERENYNLKSASTRLREFRNENNMSQSKLAIILKCSPGTIPGYELGRYLIATPFLYTICKKYKISADYLIGKTDNSQIS